MESVETSVRAPYVDSRLPVFAMLSETGNPWQGMENLPLRAKRHLLLRNIFRGII